MKSLSKALKNRIEVYYSEEVKNEFGEISYRYNMLKKVWAELLPVKSGREEILEGEALKSKTTHKITVRLKAINQPKNDMYFMYKGQKYEVMYFMPNYKNNDLIEFYCKLIIETEEDYGYDEK